ncbi:MAG: DNA primase [Bacteroidales bacterium]|nr:DNA primase [Bacteroidales bacterium]
MIDYATKERILDATRIEDVIGDFVSLKRRGANYLGLCPFHQDRNPSLSVSSTKQIFKCFACGKSGNAVTFLMEHEHLSYPEALKYLAKKYGIEVVEKEETPEDIAKRQKYESLLIVSEFAGKYYQDALWNPEKSKLVGLSYFKERGFSDETIRKFGLGYAPKSGKTFAQTALEGGYKREFLVETGLCIEREDGTLADRFFDRVMFPVFSLSGRIIAFGGRILFNDPEKKLAKYVNSPTSEIYSKEDSLYGIYQAKSEIGKQDKCYLVEGYADVISMHQAGIENVVASSGTSLTVGQIKLIKRFTENITIIYDGDAAGIHAAVRGVNLVLAEGMKVKVVILPAEDDPDSFARAHSKAEIEEYIAANEQDFVSFRAKLITESSNDVYKRTQLINEIIETISVIPDQIERNVYVDMVSSGFNVKTDAIYQKIKELRDKRRSQEEARRRVEDRRESYPVQDEPIESAPDPVSAPITNSVLATGEKDILYYLLKYGEYPLFRDEDLRMGRKKDEVPTVSQFIYSSLSQDELTFENPLYRAVYEEYYSFPKEEDENCEKVQGKVIRHFMTHDNQEFSKLMCDTLSDAHPITIKSYVDSMTPEEHLLGKNVPRILLFYKLKVIDLASNALVKRINEEEKLGNQEKQKELVNQLMMLGKVKMALNNEINRL